MNHSINSCEERLSGKGLIDFEHLSTHPEDILYIVSRYNSDMAFRNNVISNIRRDVVFRNRFYFYFQGLVPKESTEKRR